MLPFTREQFFAVFAGYNEAVWPVQWLAFAAGVAIVVLLVRPTRSSSRIIGAALAAMWAFTGIAYHALHFSTINKAAFGFAALFVLQAVLLFIVATVRGQVAFRPSATLAGGLGAALVVYALVGYALVGAWFGQRYPAIPMFGITPCPLTLFTFGLLFMAAPLPRGLLVIPVVWSLIGASGGFLLDVPEDWPLLFSGVAAVVLVWQFTSAGTRLSASR
jgi:hypothetical protein